MLVPKLEEAKYDVDIHFQQETGAIADTLLIFGNCFFPSRVRVSNTHDGMEVISISKER